MKTLLTENIPVVVLETQTSQKRLNTTFTLDLLLVTQTNESCQLSIVVGIILSFGGYLC